MKKYSTGHWLRTWEWQRFIGGPQKPTLTDYEWIIFTCFFCWFYVYEWLKVQFFNYTELCFKGPRNSHLMILLDDESDVLHNADKNFYYHSCIADENLLFMSFFCFVSPVWFDWYLFQVKYGFSTLDWNQLMNMKIKRQAYVWFYLKTFFSCLMIWSTFFLQFRSIDKDADYLWTHLSTFVFFRIWWFAQLTTVNCNPLCWVWFLMIIRVLPPVHLKTKETLFLHLTGASILHCFLCQRTNVRVWIIYLWWQHT